jgi:hypothetical protein
MEEIDAPEGAVEDGHYRHPCFSDIKAVPPLPIPCRSPRNLRAAIAFAVVKVFMTGNRVSDAPTGGVQHVEGTNGNGNAHGYGYGVHPSWGLQRDVTVEEYVTGGSGSM